MNNNTATVAASFAPFAHVDSLRPGARLTWTTCPFGDRVCRVAVDDDMGGMWERVAGVDDAAAMLNAHDVFASVTSAQWAG